MTRPTGIGGGTTSIATGRSASADEDEAVRELLDGWAPGPVGVIVFVSAGYDLDRVAAQLEHALPGAVVVGCTTAGQIGPAGFERHGMTAVGLYAPTFEVASYPIVPLEHMVDVLPSTLEDITEFLAEGNAPHAFGLLLVDGLSKAEERLAAGLYAGLGDLAIVGGSAGDDLAYECTMVLVDGKFRDNAAVLTLVKSHRPVSTFRVMHHEPSTQRLVVTDANPDQRRVNTINGRPAARAYAANVGMSLEHLGPETFSKYPLMIQVGEQHYIRAIQRVVDEALDFSCAVERGMVLRVARPTDDILGALERGLETARQQVGEVGVILGCDCILRRIELEHLGLDHAVGKLFAQRRVVGFSTYGEQFNGLHMNQTFTGVALGI